MAAAALAACALLGGGGSGLHCSPPRRSFLQARRVPVLNLGLLQRLCQGKAVFWPLLLPALSASLVDIPGRGEE